MKKNIAVIFGGNNSEHDVSLSSVSSVIDVINCDKYNVMYVAVLKNGNWIIGEDALKYFETRDDTKLVERNDISQFVQMASEGKIDLVLPILHGAFGEDGRLQGFLDILDVPYVFSGYFAHALAMDKSKAKIIGKNCGIPIIASQTFHKDEKISSYNIIKELDLPLVVKPNNAGSSVGISMVTETDDLDSAIQIAFQYSDQIIIEKMITARELTVGIIKNQGIMNVLSIIEIIPKDAQWYDYDAKYQTGGSEHICPAQIPQNIEDLAKEYAQKIFEIVGCEDLARIDFLWNEKNDEMYFLEINTIPGMTATSLAPEAARAAGISFEQLINSLIENNL